LKKVAKISGDTSSQTWLRQKPYSSRNQTRSTRRLLATSLFASFSTEKEEEKREQSSER